MSKIVDRIKREVKEKGVFNGISYIILKAGYRFLIKGYIFFYTKMNHDLDERAILFQSTPSYSDNAKALSDYLLKEYQDYSIHYLVDDPQQYHIEGIHFYPFKNLKYGELSLQAIPIICKSKYIFFTHESPISNRWFKQRVNHQQVVVNLWHGCGFKDKGKDETIPFVEKEPFDYALVPGPLFVEPKSRFWGCDPNLILPIGYPRYDWMLEKNARVEDFADKIAKGRKIIMWMPTFRKNVNSYMPENDINYTFDIPLLKNKQDLIELDHLCKENNLLLIIKRHPQQKKYSCEDMKLEAIEFFSNDSFENNHVEMYSFLHYTSGLISDYSSIAFDYLLLDHPIAYSLDDYHQYKDVRGFVFQNPLDYMPGNHLYTFEDLKEYLLDCSKGIDHYQKERKQVKQQAITIQENYCQSLLNIILEGRK